MVPHQLGHCGTVHPRVYGEYLLEPFEVDHSFGSSPRVRGIRKLKRLPILAGRFIPACTGNTDISVNVFKLEAVHPRVYGEYESNASVSECAIGSSPRVRGIR